MAWKPYTVIDDTSGATADEPDLREIASQVNRNLVCILNELKLFNARFEEVHETDIEATDI